MSTGILIIGFIIEAATLAVFIKAMMNVLPDKNTRRRINLSSTDNLGLLHHRR